MSGVLSRYTCQSYGHNFRHESQLLRHLNKKNPCLPPGQSRFHTAFCDANFPSNAKLKAHLRSRGHKARIDERRTGAERQNSVEIPAHPPAIDAVTEPSVGVKPIDFGKYDDDALDGLQKQSGQDLMARLSINPGGCGYTPFAKLFKVLFLDDKVPNNINVLMEGQW